MQLDGNAAQCAIQSSHAFGRNRGVRSPIIMSRILKHLVGYRCGLWSSRGIISPQDVLAPVKFGMKRSIATDVESPRYPVQLGDRECISVLPIHQLSVVGDPGESWKPQNISPAEERWPCMLDVNIISWKRKAVIQSTIPILTH